MPPDLAWILSWTAVASLLAMALVWVVQLRTKDAGLVDLAWTLAFPATAWFGCFALDTGDFHRRLFLGALVTLWAGRLSWHIYSDRIRPGREDGRYTDLRREKGPSFQRWLFCFYLAQGLTIPALASTHLVAMRVEEPLFRPLDLFAAAWIAAAVLGEAVADRQLARFRRDGGKGVCERGLWRWSRHPNYFFEWMHWLAWPLFAIGSDLPWAAWIAPAVMLLLLLKVTGIPPIERRALARKGEVYRRYQRSTSAFFPWPRRRAAAVRPDSP